MPVPSRVAVPIAQNKDATWMEQSRAGTHHAGSTPPESPPKVARHVDRRRLRNVFRRGTPTRWLTLSAGAAAGTRGFALVRRGPRHDSEGHSWRAGHSPGPLSAETGEASDSGRGASSGLSGERHNGPVTLGRLARVRQMIGHFTGRIQSRSVARKGRRAYRFGRP